MSHKIPVFPMTQQPQHFNDYGFEPQIDYFQVLEEARKQKKRESSSTGRSMDLHYRLQKPISKEIKKSSSSKKKRWWRNALLFFKIPKWAPPAAEMGGRRHRIGSISGPIYITDSGSGGGAAKLGKIPYMSLEQRHVVPATPIYLVT